MTLTFRFLNFPVTPDTWLRLRVAGQGRRGLADLLAKDNDRLLDDIGLTRAEAERLQRQPWSAR